MNNYYLLIYLKQTLDKNLLSGEFLFAISPHKDVIEFYINGDNKTNRLILSTKPDETALFTDQYRPPKKQNVLHFFDELKGQKIEEITLATHDRLLTIHFNDEHKLLFKLYGNDVNVFLVKDERIQDAFKHPETVIGKTPPEPAAPDFENKITGKAKPKNQLTKLNPLLPRSLLTPLTKHHHVDKLRVDEVKAFTVKITDALLNDPHPRVLKNGKITLWNETLLPLETEKVFQTVNEAVRFAYRNSVHLRRLHNKKDKLTRLLERQLQKKEAELSQLRQADKSLERADKYKKYGHLLMTRAHETLESAQDKIEIADIYNDNKRIEISVKTENSIAENAEYYYEKSEAAKRSYQKAKRRIPKVKNLVSELRSLHKQLIKIENLPELNKWIKQKKKLLQKHGYGSEEGEQLASPYRKFSAGKYEIWIGKNAKSNDKLTALAHKEDIWLHARGVGGSHTLIRMGNQKEYPPKEIILHAASYAAYYSKAKGAKTAPVIYTKRKYIYKPKGADPGTVVVDREQVVMVPPVKPGKF